jgi:long-chain fatty acid transport protein
MSGNRNRRRRHRHASTLIGLAVAGALAPAAATYAGGIEVPMQSARASGQADAFIAQADDASAVWYNPAGLTQTRGTQAIVGGVGLFMNWNFDADNGGTDQSMNDEAFLPHLYVSSDFGTERFRAGLGINNSFGLSEDWGDTGPLRFIVDDAKLAAINISPAVAYQVTDALSLGFALNVYYARASIDRQAILGAPPTPEGYFELDGHDWAVGYTPSFLWRINERHSVGGFYRSPVNLDIHGEAEIEMGDTSVVGPVRTNLPVMLPQQIGLGYAFRPIEPLKLEFDVIWTDWNALDRLRISSDNPLINGQQIPADWRSGFTYRLGGQYAINDNWTVRAGYAYSENAIPDQTYTPIVPDSDYHLIALGLGYTTGPLSLDLAYNFIYRETRHIDSAVLSPTVDGDWQNTIHTVALSATYRF